MSQARRQATTETRMIQALVAAAIGATSLLLGAFVYQTISRREITTWNPVALLISLLSGHQNVSWTIIIPIAGAALTESLLLWFFWNRIGPGKHSPKRRGDHVSRITGEDITPLKTKAVSQKADRLGIETIGLPVGITVRGQTPLFSSWEDVSTLIAGMRTGKTTSWVIPRILETPGAVIVTSNKRDVVDATINPRTSNGSTGWVFDPQNVVANRPQACWWNPLSFVTDSTTALKLANVFVDATRDRDTTSNAFFDNSARDLVAALILAASLAERPITDVYTWVNNDKRIPEAVDDLIANGESLWAERLESLNYLVPETRSGVFGGASTMLQFLSNTQNNKWVTPQQNIPQFHPRQFVHSKDTLYALSLEGGGSAAPILAALTVAVAEAALEAGAQSPGGRLPTPMLIELDEAANICPWRELPDQYSHFGSRGIVVDTILQSWSQGAEVWGEAGMKKLWGPANLSLYLGGSKEINFLKDLSDLIGTTWEDTNSITRNYGRHTTTTNYETQQRNIATIADLAALPLGRAWVFASGATPVLVETQPWMTSTHAQAINQSIAHNSQ